MRALPLHNARRGEILMHRKTILTLATILLLAALFTRSARADKFSPWEAADALRDSLFQAQKAVLNGDASAAATHVVAARQAAAALATLPAPAQSLLDEALAAAATAAADEDAAALAGARGLAQGAVFWGSYQRTRQAVQNGDAALAQQWLLVRDYRLSTRFSRPGADATLALQQMDAHSPDETLARLDADLLDTYQARLAEHLQTAVDDNQLLARRAESAGLAQSYWHILAPAYARQNGQSAADAVTADFDRLLPTLLQADEAARQQLGQQLQATVHSFRAAPLSPTEQARRAGQMLRFLNLVPVEYGRGVTDGAVLIEFEVQEAVSFMSGAQAAFADLRLTLAQIDPAQTEALAARMQQLAADLDAANRRQRVTPVAEIEEATTAVTAALQDLFPAEWLERNSDADFDVLTSVLDQMETAVRADDYELAESSRLEAYAIFDFGPEPRLQAFAPPLVAQIDGLFWQGYNGRSGLAQAIALQAPPEEIAAIRAELDAALAEAQLTLGDLPSAPGAIITNAAIIVFREGLESVVILAALMASMVGAYAHYRRPMVLGVALSLATTVITWWLAQWLLAAFVNFGEKLEAVVSLIAIAVLLLITNWFFHKTYWKDWMANFHQQKRQVLGREAGQFLGLVLLGFTSMYREGFETVLFLQALVLDAGTAVVLEGVALGVVGVILIGAVTFQMQKRLPYKKMLVWTGVLIGLVLVTMVGKTGHVLQAVRWLPITPIKGIALPYWGGLWFGLYATWQGIALQVAAAVFVVGSYFGAEWLQARRRKDYRRRTSHASSNV